jgi:hypothetical protein
MEAFETELLDAVSARRVGQPVVKAFGRFVLRPRGLLAAEDDRSADLLRSVSLMISGSPALRARQQVIFARYTASLAELIAADTGAGPDDLRPWVVAHALMGIHQALVAFVHTRLAQGMSDRARLARDVRNHGQRAFRLLEDGLADYATQPTGRVGDETR